MSDLSSMTAALAPASGIDMTMTEGHKLSAQLIALGEKLGAFKPYDSQLPVADIKDTRIVKCLYQIATSGKNKGKKVQENAYTRVPTSHITEEIVTARIDELAPYVVSWLQGLEDAAIKEYHRVGGTQVYIAGLTLDALIEKLEESEAGARLNKEKIEAWFGQYIEASLTELFAGKLGLDENSSEAELLRLETVLEAYKAKFASLASGKVFIKEADCIAMVGVIKSCEPEEVTRSAIGKRFIVRLEGMNKKEEDMLLAL